MPQRPWREEESDDPPSPRCWWAYVSTTYRRLRLDDGPLLQIAAGREIARVAHVSRTGSEEIGIQRNDNVRLIEAIYRIDGLAEGQPSAFDDAIAAARFILMPFGFRELLEKRYAAARQAWAT